ncbi:MAG TPA: 2OG-Fe(II) oxygenase [Blastocatellia bacterium]|nr:2OG-Fe(II) oxygenase [Blastocatellia bacterium]
MYTSREEIGAAIARRLRAQRQELEEMWHASTPVRHFFVDDLLPEEEARTLAQSFPDPGDLMLRSTMRERKRVGVEVRKYQPRVGEFIFAFQRPEVIQAVADITGLEGIEADPSLYASGISVMGKGDFLNPHIDNSHDGDGTRYRVLNLLFYVSPDWRLENGGNLELWDSRVRRAYPILSRFNRLVVMETHASSWHSVNRVLVDAPRLCVSNYYFSSRPPGGKSYSNMTTFTGRPEERVKRIILNLDGLARNALGKTFPALRNRTKHRLRET